MTPLQLAQPGADSPHAHPARSKPPALPCRGAAPIGRAGSMSPGVTRGGTVVLWARLGCWGKAHLKVQAAHIPIHA